MKSSVRIYTEYKIENKISSNDWLTSTDLAADPTKTVGDLKGQIRGLAKFSPDKYTVVKEEFGVKNGNNLPDTELLGSVNLDSIWYYLVYQDK